MSRDSHYNEQDPTSEAVRAVLRFLRVVRYRKSYLIVALTTAVLLGGVYYLTAARIYEAKASLLITQSSPDVWNGAASSEVGRHGLIPTYEQLFSSAVILNGATQRLARLPAALRVDFFSVPRDKWIDVLRANLVARSLRNTNIIELSCRSRDPAAGEAVVGAVVDSYLEFIERNHKDVSVEVVTILEKERQVTEAKLEQKKRSLLELKRRIKDFGLREGSIHPEVQRVLQLNKTIMGVQEERLQLQASLAAVRSAVTSGKDLRQHLINLEPVVGDRLISSALGISPLSSQLVNDMEQKLLEDRSKLAMYRGHYGPNHPRVRQLEHSLQLFQAHREEYHAKVQKHMEKVQERELGPLLISMLEEKLVEAWMFENGLLKEYRALEESALTLNDDMAELTITEQDMERLSRLHDTLLERISNIDMTRHRANVRVSVVSEPAASRLPVSPRLAFVGVLCLAFGLGGGTGLIYVLDLLDDRFRSPEELQEQLELPVLAMIGNLEAGNESGLGALQVHASPDAVESEAFRTLRTTLAFSENATECIAVTSSEPGDGKTTVLANLGLVWAQVGKKTLLIDADMRRPGLSRLLDMRGTSGLSDVLRGEGSVGEICEQLVQSADVPHLDVLSCGPRPADPVELLSGTRIVDLLGWAQSRYDQILIDCPPIMAASDAAIVGHLADGIVLVVQPEKNHRRIVFRAVASLLGMRNKVIGIVANRIQAKDQRGYYGYGYTYDYGSPEDENEQVSTSEPTADAPQEQVSPDPAGSSRAARKRVVPRRAA